MTRWLRSVLPPGFTMTVHGPEGAGSGGDRGRRDLGVGALDVYYLYEHGDAPIVLSTADEVGDSVDRVRAESSPAAAILMDVHLSDDRTRKGRTSVSRLITA
ncbi:hypothetical protein CKY47_11385 [Saccharothrix yanglingensis]|uniref:Uncharacterized protein n=1 Tax=Saccharothrix yanglingensis TaxID=659496 RepID=A0ABU0WXI9_9PSEU|nr:hypothetical protein [Saccharothrix yanglingensis]